MPSYSEKELIETAKEWLDSEYKYYPEYIEEFGVRNFSPVPTVTLTEPISVKLLGKAIEHHGYTAKTRRDENGNVLIAASIQVEDLGEEILYTFETNRTFSLDGPLQHESPPEDGRIAILSTYLNAKHKLENEE